MVPNFSVARRKLPAICERRFHRCIAMAFEHGHVVTAIEQCISGSNAGNAGTNNGDVCHEGASRVQTWTKSAEADRRSPSVAVPESLTRASLRECPLRWTQ